MIDEFRGPTRWLSNFGEVPRMFAFGITIPTTEHGYQAAKCANEVDREAILTAPTPRKAKNLGMNVVLRADWEDVKEHVMYTLLRRKFANAGLQKQLLDTGDKCLVEGNTWGDQCWGAVMTPRAKSGDCPKYTWWPPGQNPNDHEEMLIGDNLLGILLMRVRQELRDLRGL